MLQENVAMFLVINATPLSIMISEMLHCNETVCGKVNIKL